MKKNTFFSLTTNFFSLFNMPYMVRLHQSVKEIWEGVNESYGQHVKDQITVLRNLKLTWQHCSASCINQNVLCIWMWIIHCGGKVYGRNPSYKLHESLDQENSKLTARSGVLSRMRLMNDEQYMFAFMGKNVEKMGLFFIKLSLMIRKYWGCNLWCRTRNVHNMDTDQLVFGDKTSWIHQYQIILCFIQWSVRRIQMSYLQFFAIAERRGTLMITVSKSLYLIQMKNYLGKSLFKIKKF